LKVQDEEKVRPLDATVTAEVVSNLRNWINAKGVLSSELYLDYVQGTDGLGFCVKADSGSIIEEDILEGYSAEIVFAVYYKTNATPDGGGLIYKPLNDLSKWLAENDFTNLDMGTRRTPKEIMTLRGPVDASGRDTNGNTTFYSIYKFIFTEEDN